MRTLKEVQIESLRYEAQNARPTFKAAALLVADLIERDDVAALCSFCKENANKKSVQSAHVRAVSYLYEEHALTPSMYM